MKITNKHGRITLYNNNNKQIAVIQSNLGKCEDGKIMKLFLNEFFDKKHKYENNFEESNTKKFMDLFKIAKAEYKKKDELFARCEVCWLELF